MFDRLAGFSERRAWWLIAGWLIAMVGLAVVAPSLNDVGTQDTSSFLPADAPSQRADRVLQQLFPNDPTRESAIVVMAREGGLTDTDHGYAGQLSEWLRSPGMAERVKAVQSVADSPDLAPFLRSPDGAAELLVVSFTTAPFTPQTNDAVHAVREHLEATAPDGLTHNLTGIAGLASDQADALLESFDRTAIVSVVLVLLILFLVYRSAVAPLVPLVTIGVAFIVAQSVVGLLAEAGMRVSSQVGTFMVVMIFGAGTDYCLFIVSRYRQDLAHGEPVPATVRRTMRIMGAVIAASAATVIVGFLSQLTAEFGIYRTMGPAMGIAILITLIAGLTLTPALLRVTGTKVFWPQRLDAVRGTSDHSARWDRLAAVIRRRPAEMFLAGIIALLIPAAGLGWFSQSFDLVNDLPPDADARQGFETLSGHYPGGTLSPIYLVVRSNGPILEDARMAAIDRLTDELRTQPGIAEVRSVTQPAAAPLTMETLSRFGDGDPASIGLDPNQVDLAPLLDALASPSGLRFTATMLQQFPQITDRLGLLLGVDGNSTRLIIALEGNPYETDALDAFKTIDDTTARTLAGTALSDAQFVVGGPTSFYVDMRTIANRDFRVMTAVLIAAIFVVLAALLRSLVAPLYLLLTVVLSYAATMGICVVLFQGIMGDPGISFWLPSFLFIILVALGADYNIFIMSRIREEADAGYEIHEATSRGMVLTGRVITSAGLILAGTFAALMLAPLPNLRQIGVGVTLGVLIDTFLVRSILVPSATMVFGRWAFWPVLPGTRSARAALTPHRVGAAIAAVTALVAVLAALVLTSDIDEPVTSVAAAATTQTKAPPSSAATAAAQTAPPTPEASSADQSTTTVAAPADAVTAAPGAPPPDSEPAGPARVATPAAGSWRYHLDGTRKLGAAGSPQSFKEDATTDVTHTGGTAEAPEVRLRTESSNGSQEQVRRYAPDAVQLLATELASGPTTFGGTFQPPQTLIRWPIEIGATWSSDWTTGSTSGHTDSRVIGERDLTIAGRALHCYDVRSDTTFTGDASGEQHQTACWSPELGMILEATEEFAGTYDGIAFEVRSHSLLIAGP
ncbi:MAG: MMPL family transporter [Actinomycetota bacterium]